MSSFQCLTDFFEGNRPRRPKTEVLMCPMIERNVLPPSFGSDANFQMDFEASLLQCVRSPECPAFARWQEKRS